MHFPIAMRKTMKRKNLSGKNLFGCDDVDDAFVKFNLFLKFNVEMH